MKKNKLYGLIGGVALLALTSIVHAVPYCVSPGGPNTSGLSTGDVTYGGGNALDCYGAVLSDNDNATKVNGINNNGAIGWKDPVNLWTSLAKAQQGNSWSDTGSFGGLDFTLSSNQIVDASSSTIPASGDWSLSWTDPLPTSIPLALDLMVVVKGGPDWAAYLLDDIQIVTAPGSGSGTWVFKLQKVNNNNFSNLSHMSLYVRNGELTELPEPSTLLLSALGLMGIGFYGRRRRRY